MAKVPEKKWNINAKDIKVDPKKAVDLERKWSEAKATMAQRTKGFELFSRIAHNQPLPNPMSKRLAVSEFSEGTTQAMKRKLRSQTIQRVPDGEIITQFDKNSIEQVETEFLFKKKVLTSEFSNKNMLKNLWRTFNAAYDYGFCCVRTGFEKDIDGDVRCSYSLIKWNDVYPAPDSEYIEEAPWYIIREYISKSTLESLIDDDGECHDKTYDAEVVKYLIDNEIGDGIDPLSLPLADREKGAIPFQSVEIRTMYERGNDKFITYVPSIQAILRTVDNYDPRKDIPLNFMILEPDPEFPLGCSAIMWTMAYQQQADALSSTAHGAIWLSMLPPLMMFGNLTNAGIRMKPNAVWNMGTNPNNKVEKFPVETTTLTQYGSIMNNISANMQKNLNISDSTVASDANVSGYSATPQGVDLQKREKTITVNQYQKAVESFFSAWANHALRSYINATSGKQDITVDETTRRKIWDIEASSNKNKEIPDESIINGDKISIDFDSLSADMLSFEVRTGSLIENERDVERKNIQELLVPVSQMLGAVSEGSKESFEKTIMQLIVRLCEVSNVDISQSAADNINEKLLLEAMQATMQQVQQQGGQINQMQQMMMAAQQGQQSQMPPEQGQALSPTAQAPVPPEVSAEFPASAQGLSAKGDGGMMLA